MKNEVTSCDDLVIGGMGSRADERTLLFMSVPSASRTRIRSSCARGRLPVEVALRPLRADRPPRRAALVRSLGAWVAEGTVHDHFIQLTEGVVAREELAPSSGRCRPTVRHRSADRVTLALELSGGRRARLEVRISADDRITFRLEPERDPLRIALDWRRRSDERFVGLGARHWTPVRPGRARRAARRRPSLHRTRLPGRAARRRGHPAGRLRAGAVAQSSRGYAVWVRSEANGIRFDLAGERVGGVDALVGRSARARGVLPPHAGGAAAGVLPADRLPGRPARVGLRVLEEPRRLRARGRRSRRLRGHAPARHPARRDRASTRPGPRNTTPGSSTRTSSRTRPG